jgi:hypothetical protein
MRTTATFLLALLAAPAHATAWDVTLIDGACALISDRPGQTVTITHDPAIPLYTLTATRAAPWPDTTMFGIAFTGGEAMTITTDRQTFSDDRLSLIVTDSGFGNVFLGMETNSLATFFTDTDALPVPLDGAAEAIAEFEACGATPAV